jgi:hypothetical protein
MRRPDAPQKGQQERGRIHNTPPMPGYHGKSVAYGHRQVYRL